MIKTFWDFKWFKHSGIAVPTSLPMALQDNNKMTASHDWDVVIKKEELFGVKMHHLCWKDLQVDWQHFWWQGACLGSYIHYGVAFVPPWI